MKSLMKHCRMKSRHKANSLNLSSRRAPVQLVNMRFVAPTAENPKFTFTGYAVKWDSVNDYGERFVKGAFADQIASKETVHMYYNHGWRNYFGGDTSRIGLWTSLTEDDVGLLVTGELTPSLNLASQVQAMLQHGTVDGLSVCFYEIQRGDWTFNNDVKVISNARLYEISVVDEPADYDARIDDALEELETEQDAVELLERYGLREKLARSIISQVSKVSSTPIPLSDAEVRAAKMRAALDELNVIETT